ncbi:hypothetical protein [Microbacterium saperdae]|uniref:hypothetical protein n=1 Tax=Microbacterium saperdae TaxID=69368 RepID=UPI001150D797|nr:hypothetical protein [Microbacterium saperdae]GGM38267.1 hypothetical protein GCM10010489_06590 [Microbacterium saperdae]
MRATRATVLLLAVLVLCALTVHWFFFAGNLLPLLRPELDTGGATWRSLFGTYLLLVAAGCAVPVVAALTGLRSWGVWLTAQILTGVVAICFGLVIMFLILLAGIGFEPGESRPWHSGSVIPIGLVAIAPIVSCGILSNRLASWTEEDRAWRGRALGLSAVLLVVSIALAGLSTLFVHLDRG